MLSKDVICTGELESQLRSIFLLGIFKNLFEIGIPFIKNKLNTRKKAALFKIDKTDSNDDKLLIRIEQQLDRSPYMFKDIDGTYYDYLELFL